MEAGLFDTLWSWTVVVIKVGVMAYVGLCILLLVFGVFVSILCGRSK